VDENIIDFQKARDDKRTEEDDAMFEFFLNQPPTLTPEQCSQGRTVLNWSQEALAFKSGVSVKTIKQFEVGTRAIRVVTKVALTFALESEGLIIIPGSRPMTSDSCRGITQDPRNRPDFHLIE
jgi:DNA-binding transcriptional regulator YiaG